MTSESDQFELRVLNVLEKMLAQPEQRRRDFIFAKTHNDPELQARLLAIVDANIDGPQMLITGGALDTVSSGRLPEKIGVYNIEKEIGRGGMGSIYLGRRNADDFDHVAAIKVVRPGLVSPKLMDRLRSERRTLAKLKHPKIAQMYDGGELEDGASFFVMEYVDGDPLNHYLEQSNADLSERLRVFLDVCEAVSFAHRNLIIHRDLTPSNILVSKDGQVKLIDFGIAHSLGGNDADTRSRTTQTNGYAAPERFDDLPASTVTDIYSLGIILEEMVAGIPAPRKSDLIAVARKAGASNSESRYQTVDALVEDVNAYQRKEPVIAIDGGWRYGLTRFLGRRKFAVGTAISVFAASLIAGVAMTVLFFRADAAERQAVLAEQQANERFEEVRELAGFIMFDFHDEVAKLEGSTAAREQLVKTALNYLDTLDSTPGTSNDLKREVALGYKRLSEVTGNPNNINLGRWEQSAELLDKAAVKIRELKASSEEPTILDAFVEILFAEAGHVGLSRNNFEGAIDIFLEAQRVSSREISNNRAPLSMHLNDAYIDAMHGYLLGGLGEGEKAIELISRAVSKYEKLSADHPANSTAKLGLARANVTLGEAISWHEYYTEGEKSDSAIPYFDLGISENKKILEDPNASVRAKSHLVIALLKKANTTCSLDDKKHQSSGIKDLEDAQSLNNQLLAENPNNDRAVDLNKFLSMQRIECLQNVGRVDEAISVGGETIRTHQARIASRPNDPQAIRDLANTYWVLSLIHQERDDWPQACAMGVQAGQTLDQLKDLQSAENALLREERDRQEKLRAECDERGI